MPYSYSMVTWDFPSGLRYGRSRSLRTVRHLLAEAVRQGDRQWHEFRRLVAGVAYHHALIACAKGLNIMVLVWQLMSEFRVSVFTPWEMSDDCSCTETAMPHDW